MTNNVTTGKDDDKGDRISPKEWLAAKVARGAIRPFAEAVEITPELATLLLEKNPNNRKIKKTLVARLVDDIVNNRWELNGETIIIADNGMLNDGQNRLTAVIEANIPIVSMVMFGAPRKSRLTTDQGAARRIGDVAEMQGYESGAHNAAAATFLISYLKVGHLFNPRFHTTRPSRKEILQTLDKYPELPKLVGNMKWANASSKPLLAFCRWVIEQSVNDKASIDNFFEKLRTGAGLEEQDPILSARNRLLMRDHRMTANERAHLIIGTWNAHRQGKRLAFIRVPTEAAASLPEVVK